MKLWSLLILAATFGGCAQASADVFDTIKVEAKDRVAFRYPGRPTAVYDREAIGFRLGNGDPWLCGAGYVPRDDGFVDHFQFVTNGREFFIDADYPADGQTFMTTVYDTHCPQDGLVRLVEMGG